MGSGNGEPDAGRGAGRQEPPGGRHGASHGPGEPDGLASLDDADIADLWVVDPQTGEFRMQTPDEIAAIAAAADAAVVVEPAEAASVPVQRGRAGRGRDAAPFPPKSKLKKRLKWTAIGLTITLVAIVGAAYGYYEYLNSRIKTGDPSAAVTRPPDAPVDAEGRKQMNILLIGSDSRVGEGNDGYGDKGSTGHADTTILLHLSADRSNATLVSIPRDTKVYRPACKKDGQPTKPEAKESWFNDSMLQPYGPSCTVATAEWMLGVKIDHWLMIEFKGVKEMTKAVGGVEVNLCDPLDDPVLPNHGGGTGLHLPAGKHPIEGEDALNFLRVRHGFKDASDLVRIEAQKAFLGSLVREIKNNAKWSNPKAVFDIAQAATGNLTVDTGLNRIEKLVSLGNEIKKVPESRMAFTTLPVIDVPNENPRTHVQPIEPKATNMWTSIRNDVPFTAGDPNAPPTSEPPPAPATTGPPPAPPVDPSTIKVTVRNSTKTPRAKAVADQLKGLRYQATADTKNIPEQPNSSITYPKGQLDTAKQLAAAVGVPETRLTEATKGETTFTVTIGLDFPAAQATPKPGVSASGPVLPTNPTAPAPPPAADVKLKTADNDSCIKTSHSK
ncbi:LCP family protein [Yinghuangia seranimata]|uniref:LCP family protein n=1 Tax=Yinghuangia seranimata TaxID=408067 RepID=UPI00248BDA34|nr:LCP family protein [Yinghuangia seranimata]MDI2132253.1 LCP family protein [Yinghuangia seranimata]